MTLIAVNFITAIVWAKYLFGGWKGYWQAVAYSYTPDFVSFFQGRLLRDWKASFKLTVWMIVNVVTFAGELWLVAEMGIL